MDKSKHDQLTQEVSNFAEKLHKKYHCGLGIMAIDMGNNGDVVLGTMFGKKSMLNDRVCDRLLETCESTIKGAKIEFAEEAETSDIELPDPENKKEVMKFLVEHDLFNDEGEISKEKVDRLFAKIAKRKMSEYAEKIKKELDKE